MLVPAVSRDPLEIESDLLGVFAAPDERARLGRELLRLEGFRGLDGSGGAPCQIVNRPGRRGDGHGY